MGQWWAVPPTKTENDARMTTVICVICRPVNEMYRPGEVWMATYSAVSGSNRFLVGDLLQEYRIRCSEGHKRLFS